MEHSAEFEMLTMLVDDFGLALSAFAEFVAFDSEEKHTAADSALAVYLVVEMLHSRYSTFAVWELRFQNLVDSAVDYATPDVGIR